MERRRFLLQLPVVAAGVARVPRLLAQQGASTPPAAGAGQGAPGDGTGAAPAHGESNLFDMDQGAAQSVRRAPKAGAAASMTADARDALEHDIRCQCGCTLDVYTCRTTDFSCRVSPAMHRDVMALVEGGHSAQEILDAFVETYGERALMSPKREGFNLAGYFVPFIALGGGAALLVTMLRRMQRRSAAMRASHAPPVRALPGSADELARLDDAVRHDA